jgi:amidohydrolase
MHACGHDGHTTIGLAVAKMLSAQRDEMKGRVKFVFQPAEEIGKGALAMMEDGVLVDPAPEAALGLHLHNDLPVGDVVVRSGSLMAGSAFFTVEITGRGGHAAMPNLTIDPVLALAQIITALQSVVSRNVSPLDTAVISVTKVQAGDAFNVIPQKAAFHGTLRTFNQQTHDLVVERLRTISSSIAQALGCTAELSFSAYSPTVVNDADVAARLRDGFEQVMPEFHYRDDVQTMWGEDMAYFLEKVPGTFFFVGSANNERGLNYAHHHPRFDFDEEALVIGASLLASAVSDYVLP